MLLGLTRTQFYALMFLVFLTFVALTVVALYTVWHIDVWHLLSARPMDFLYPGH